MYPSLFEEVLLLFSNSIKKSSLLTSVRFSRVLQYYHIHFLQRESNQIRHHIYSLASFRSIGANLREQGPQRLKKLLQLAGWMSSSIFSRKSRSVRSDPKTFKTRVFIPNCA
jgi:hypothetical protein